MRSPLQDLWDEVVPLDGPCPAPRPKLVAQQVNAALDAVPSERERHMKQKLRTALILAAAVLVFTGSALAVASNWTVLDTFFGGSSEVGEALMDDQVYSVEDDNYLLSVTSSVADSSSVYLVVTVEGKTPAAVEHLMSDGFENMDTWDFTFPKEEQKEESGVSISSLGTSEVKELRTAVSRTWGMELMAGSSSETVAIRLGVMEKGLWLEVPLTRAQSVTVEIGADGNGAGVLEHAAGGALTFRSVTLTPLGLTLEWSASVSEGQSRPVPSFLMTDGTLYSWSQLVSDLSKGGSVDKEGDVVNNSMDYAFRTVQDLTKLEAVVFEGRAYPLDGGKSYKVDDSGVPQPIQLPLGESLTPESGYSIAVRALCEGLGGSCQWDNASRSAVMSYQDVTIVLTEGEKTALVNGEAVELTEAPVIRNGRMMASSQVFSEAWKLDICAAKENADAELDNRIAWVIVP